MRVVRVRRVRMASAIRLPAAGPRCLSPGPGDGCGGVPRVRERDGLRTPSRRLARFALGAAAGASAELDCPPAYRAGSLVGVSLALADACSTEDDATGTLVRPPARRRSPPTQTGRDSDSRKIAMDSARPLRVLYEDT